jgi:hypothetical protein
MIEIFPGQYRGLAEALSELKKVDKGTLGELRKEIRKKTNPYLTSVRSYIQGSESLLRAAGSSSGKPAQVFHNGRTAWTQPTVKAYVSSSRYARSIIGIEATGKNGQYGYDIMDKAGLNGYESKQGQALIAMLNSRLKTQKPTRMLYRALMRELPNLTADVKFILESYADRITAKLRN